MKFDQDLVIVTFVYLWPVPHAKLYPHTSTTYIRKHQVSILFIVKENNSISRVCIKLSVTHLVPLVAKIISPLVSLILGSSVQGDLKNVLNPFPSGHHAPLQSSTALYCTYTQQNMSFRLYINAAIWCLTDIMTATHTSHTLVSFLLQLLDLESERGNK